MSAEATGWVFRHSPYKGAAFAIHLSIADSVNDQNNNEFWMKQATLADKARTGRQTVNTTIAAMIEDGYLEALDGDKVGSRQSLHQGRLLRFLMPDPLSSHTTAPPGPLSPHTTAGCPEIGQPAVVSDDSQGTQALSTQEEPKTPQPPSAAPTAFGDQVAAVFTLWQQVAGHPAAVLDNPRKRKIAAALRSHGFDVTCAAVNGLVHSPFHLGENERSTRYDGLGVILKNADAIERFAGLHLDPASRPQVKDPLAGLGGPPPARYGPQPGSVPAGESVHPVLARQRRREAEAAHA